MTEVIPGIKVGWAFKVNKRSEDNLLSLVFLCSSSILILRGSVLIFFSVDFELFFEMKHCENKFFD